MASEGVRAVADAVRRVAQIDRHVRQGRLQLEVYVRKGNCVSFERGSGQTCAMLLTDGTCILKSSGVVGQKSHGVRISGIRIEVTQQSLQGHTAHNPYLRSNLVRNNSAIVGRKAIHASPSE